MSLSRHFSLDEATSRISGILLSWFSRWKTWRDTSIVNSLVHQVALDIATSLDGAMIGDHRREDALQQLTLALAEFRQALEDIVVSTKGTLKVTSGKDIVGLLEIDLPPGYIFISGQDLEQITYTAKELHELARLISGEGEAEAISDILSLVFVEPPDHATILSWTDDAKARVINWVTQFQESCADNKIDPGPIPEELQDLILAC